MGAYTVVKNKPFFIDLSADYVDQGWTVSNGVACHSGCNSGYLPMTMNLSSAAQWTFRYKILNRTSGGINIIVNGVSGTVNSAVGEFSDTFTVTGPSVLVQFFSDGINCLSLLQIFSPTQTTTGTTFMFNEDANRFIQYSDYKPEFMLKFKNKSFGFKNGSLWENNINPIRNNFFGVQYKSLIKFYFIGNDAEEVKKLYGIEINSNEVWACPNNTDIKIFPNFRKPNGIFSRLKKGNFVNIQGKWYADFLKTLNDPRFNTEIEALMKGGDLIGQVAEITIENTSTTEVRLISVDIFYTKQNYTK